MAQKNLKFQISAVDRTKKAFGAVKKGLGGLTKAVFNFKTALVGAVGIGGLGILIKNSLEATDRIGKLSGVLGISTKDLQTFKLASQIGGLELETFAKGVRRFTDNIGDFADGVGEAKVTFEKLGITQADILPIQNDQVALLGLVADALNKVEDGAIKTKFAIEIFGGRGAELINILGGGSEALREFSKESQRFGALSEAQVRSVEAFNDSVVRLKTVLFNIVNLIVANLTPALLKISESIRENLIERFDEAGKGINEFAKKFAFGILNAIQVAIAGISDFGNTTINVLNKLIRTINKIPFTGDDIAEIQFQFDFKKLSAEIETLIPLIDSIGEHTKSVFNDIDDTTNRSKKLVGNFDMALTTITQLNEKALRDFQQRVTNIGSTIALQIDAGLKGVSRTLAEVILLGKQFDEALKKIVQETLVSTLAFFIELGLRFGLIVLLEKIFGDRIKEALNSLGNQNDSLKTQKSLVAQILGIRSAQLVIEKGITQEKRNQAEAEKSKNKQKFVSMLFGIPMFAEGGLLKRGQPAIVCERGAELVIPSANGQVFSNEDSRNILSGSGSGSTNVNFTIVANDTRDFDNLITKRRSLLVNLINQALNERGKEALV